MSNDLPGSVALPGRQTERSTESVSSLDAPLENSGEYIGDYTIKTRNFKIAAAIAVYQSKTPRAKF